MVDEIDEISKRAVTVPTCPRDYDHGEGFASLFPFLLAPLSSDFDRLPPPDHGLRSSFIFHANFMDGGTPDEINGVFLDESLLTILYNRLEAIVSERHGNFS